MALRYKGLGQALRQVKAARTGALLDGPERYGALVNTVGRTVTRPTEAQQHMVNVDGGRMLTQGDVRFSVSRQVRLIAGGQPYKKRWTASLEPIANRLASQGSVHTAHGNVRGKA